MARNRGWFLPGVRVVLLMAVVALTVVVVVATPSPIDDPNSQAPQPDGGQITLGVGQCVVPIFPTGDVEWLPVGIVGAADCSQVNAGFVIEGIETETSDTRCQKDVGFTVVVSLDDVDYCLVRNFVTGQCMPVKEKAGGIYTAWPWILIRCDRVLGGTDYAARIDMNTDHTGECWRAGGLIWSTEVPPAELCGVVLPT